MEIDKSIDKTKLIDLIREIFCTEFDICTVEQRTELSSKAKWYTGIVGCNYLEEVKE